MSEPTFLESIAEQRERTDLSWRKLGRDGRRALVLVALNQRPDVNRLAQDVAEWIGLPATQRHGSGAVAGSWSGYRSSALRVVPILRSLERDGLVRSMSDRSKRWRLAYQLTDAGRAHLDSKDTAP